MTIKYITENNSKWYGVTHKNNGDVKVQKIKDISNDENTIYSVKPMRRFLGKSQVCNMKMFSLIKKYLTEMLFYLKEVKKMVKINMYILVVICCVLL